MLCFIFQPQKVHAMVLGACNRHHAQRSSFNFLCDYSLPLWAPSLLPSNTAVAFVHLYKVRRSCLDDAVPIHRSSEISPINVGLRAIPCLHLFWKPLPLGLPMYRTTPVETLGIANPPAFDCGSYKRHTFTYISFRLNFDLNSPLIF